MKSEIRPGILKTADSSGVPGSESPAGLVASPGVGGSMDSNLGIVGSSFMDTFRMSCTDCNRSVLDSAEKEENQSTSIQDGCSTTCIGWMVLDGWSWMVFIHGMVSG